MVRFFFFMLASIAALLPSIAHGERRELITGVEVGLTVLHLDEPLRGAGATNSVGGEASAHAYWGLSNVFHVGAAFHYTFVSNAAFSGVSLALPDGRDSTGTNYENLSAISGTAVLLWQFNFGSQFVPSAQLEGGIASITYSEIAHVPSGQNYSVPFPDTSQTRFEGRGSFRVEYRSFDKLNVGVGIGFVVHPSAMNLWSVYLPLSLSWIW